MELPPPGLDYCTFMSFREPRSIKNLKYFLASEKYKFGLEFQMGLKNLCAARNSYEWNTTKRN